MNHLQVPEVPDFLRGARAGEITGFSRFSVEIFVGTSGVFCESLLGQWLNFKLFGITIFRRENKVQALFSGSRTAK